MVIFHPCAQKPPWTHMHQIWHSRRGRRRIHLWQIFWWSVDGCRFCGGRKLPFPIDKLYINMVHHESVMETINFGVKNNTPLSVFRRKTILTFAAGFSMRHVCDADTADCGFSMRGVFRSQPAPTWVTALWRVLDSSVFLNDHLDSRICTDLLIKKAM